MNKDAIDRREFIKAAAAVGAGIALANVSGVQAQPASTPQTQHKSLVGFTTPPMQKIRLGFVGTGGRGTSLIREFLKCEGTEVNAVCDLRPERAAKAKEIVEAAQRGTPEIYSKGDHDYERLCSRDDIDLVINATPWEWHVPVALDAMNKGKHVGVEVPAAMTVEDCWKLVDTAEATQKHCMMMENCCYGASELALLNAVRQGVFGDILHGEGGYLHDLQQVKFDENGEGAWRRKYSEKFNGNLYPTHGLGPVAHCMNINRGDRFAYLVSMSGPSRGLQMYAAEHLANDDPRKNTEYKLGDVNTSLIQTARGKTLMVQHDTNTSRPYSRINNLVGTKGIFCGYPDRVGIGEKWGNIDEFLKNYEHPLVAQTKEGAKGAGHGGMDFTMVYRLVKCLRQGLPLDMTIYDAVAWSCIVELSIKSVANKSAAMDFPDFTRGAWETAEPLGIVT
jgi:hypothetical protein